MMELLSTLGYIFIQYFLIDIFAIGGGLATVPFVQHLGEVTGWFDSLQLADMLAVVQSIPGAVGVNLAAYSGYAASGLIGGVVAAIGLVVPSIIIILVIANMLTRFKDNPLVEIVMGSLRPAALALLFVAFLSIAYNVFISGDPQVLIDAQGLHLDAAAQVFNWRSLLLFVVLMVISNLKRFKEMNPAIWIVVCAVIGIVAGL